MKVTIELTEEQLGSIFDQQQIELGLPTREEMIKFQEKCNNICKGLRKLGPLWKEDMLNNVEKEEKQNGKI